MPHSALNEHSFQKGYNIVLKFKHDYPRAERKNYQSCSKLSVRLKSFFLMRTVLTATYCKFQLLELESSTVHPSINQPIRPSPTCLELKHKQSNGNLQQCCQLGHLMARFFKFGHIGTPLAIENIFWPFTISGHKPGHLGFGASFSNFFA